MGAVVVAAPPLWPLPPACRARSSPGMGKRGPPPRPGCASSGPAGPSPGGGARPLRGAPARRLPASGLSGSPAGGPAQGGFGSSPGRSPSFPPSLCACVCVPLYVSSRQLWPVRWPSSRGSEVFATDEGKKAPVEIAGYTAGGAF